MPDLSILIITVFVFATIQSLFGVGLLIFGTPTLLLLGSSFEETIALLLPASLLISLLQILHGRRCIGELYKPILLYCIPLIVIGLVLVLNDFQIFYIKSLVGIMLIISAITRHNKRVHQAHTRFLRRYEKIYLMVMGFVHGMSNMGGGFLTIFVTTRYDDKENIRANIAYGYLLFALSQIAVLLLLHPQVFNSQCLILAAVALLTYLTFGNFVYIKFPRGTYQQFITIFMAAYGIVLMGQGVLSYSLQ